MLTLNNLLFCSAKTPRLRVLHVRTETFLERWHIFLSQSDVILWQQILSRFPAWFVSKDFLLRLVLFLLFVCFFSLSGKPCQGAPALPSRFYSLGYSVPFSTQRQGLSLSLRPPRRNHLCESPTRARYIRTRQVFGVFVFMECTNTLSIPDVRSPNTFVPREPRTSHLAMRHPSAGGFEWLAGLSRCLLTSRLMCNHPSWPLSTLRFLAALCNWWSGFLTIFLQMY